MAVPNARQRGVLQAPFRASAIEALATPNGAPSSASQIFGPRPFATLLCRFSDIPSTPIPASTYQAWFASFGAGTLSAYWSEVSSGAMSEVGSAVFGWFDLPHTKAWYSPTGNVADVQFDRMAEDCAAAADSVVYFPDFAGIDIVVNADFAGVAIGGSSWFYLDGQAKRYSFTFLPPSARNVAAHEQGHSLGLPHAGPYGPSYWNYWDVMGWAHLGSALPQEILAYHKELLGWIPSPRIFVTPPGTSRTSIILERGESPPQNGNYLVAHVGLPNGTGQFYSVEVKRQVGLDSLLLGEGVLIHLIDPSRPGNIAAYEADADHNGNPNDAGAMWLPGETFSDASAGISISVDSTAGTGYGVTIQAASSPNSYTLTISPPAGGRINESNDIGARINCPGECVATYPAGATVYLTGLADPGNAFGSWTGACGGSGSCVVSMNADRQVSALFTPGQPLHVASTGYGVVHDNLGHISCGYGAMLCTYPYPLGTAVSLTVTPSAGHTFTGWSGACSGSASCVLSLSTARTVIAAFVPDSEVVLLALSNFHHTDSVVVGTAGVQTDSAGVNVTGFHATSATWSAAHGANSWLSLATDSGTGGGTLRWSRSPVALGVGVYVDTIVVTVQGALGSPARFFDTLRVLAPLSAAITPQSHLDSLPIASRSTRADSARVILSGYGATTTPWNASHRAVGWLNVTSSAAAGPGSLRWTVSPSGLVAGNYVDTLLVTVTGAVGSPVRFIDTLRIYEPSIRLPCAETVLLAGSTCMTTVERDYLDFIGNHDGVFNLGDLLAYLDSKQIALERAHIADIVAHDSVRNPRRLHGRHPEAAP